MIIRKPGELTDPEKKTLKEEMLAGCRNIGTYSLYVSVSHRAKIYNREPFGLCKDCGHFAFTATQYKVKHALCERHERMIFRLTENEPVVECSSYYKRGEQDAHDFSKNAWLIDPEEKKKVGLI
jgi:hypothetical protein